MKAGFDNVTTVNTKFSRSELANSVGKLVTGGGFFAGGHIEISHIDNIVIRGEMLGMGSEGKGKS